jgi:hypothetical protein
MVKKKSKFYKISYTEPLYSIKLVVCAGDIAKYHTYIKKEFDAEVDQDDIATMSGFFAKFDKCINAHSTQEVYVVYMNAANDFYTLSHELIHLCRKALDDRGIGVDLVKEDEVFAYLHTHLLLESWRAINNKATKKKTLRKKK